MTRALVLVLALGGCSQAVDHVRPSTANVVQPTYPVELRGNGVGRPATEIAWSAFFLDARLRALVAQALANNRDLGVATARIDEAQAQFRIVRAERLPGLDARSSVRFGNGSAGGSTGSAGGDQGADGGAGGDGSGAVGTSGTSGGGSRVQLGVAVTSFELDFWGRVRSLSEAARARYLQTVEAQRAFRIALVSDVAESYLIDRELAERAALADATIAGRRASLRIATRRFEEGEGTRLEIEAERALLTAAQGERADLAQQAASNLNALQLLVGRPIDPASQPALPPPLPLGQQGLLGDIPAGLPSDLLANRPDIIAAEEALRAATADVGAARAAFFPRIALTGSLGFQSNGLGSLFSRGPVWSFVPSIVAPLFDGGATRGNLDLATARRSIAVLEYERAVQVAFREVADALAARRYLVDRRRALEAQLGAQRERLRLTDLRFREGLSALIDVLDARREIFTVEQQLVQTRRLELANRVALYAALGGGLLE